MTFSPLRTLAVTLCKATRLLCRTFGRAGGTSLPGLVAQSIDPTVLRSLAREIPNGCILVTGTNGKTTTCRIIANALEEAGYAPIHNREGSNLLRGVATTLVTHTNLWGSLRAKPNTIGLFELDEGAFPKAVRELQPRLILITNLFRDQLDRYFEVDYLAYLWAEGLRDVSPETVVVLNGDDPQVARLGQDTAGKVIYFGLEDRHHGQPTLEHASDSRRCPTCGVHYCYSFSLYAHLGHYHCPLCGWRRPQPQVAVERATLDGFNSSTIHVKGLTGETCIELPLPGLYNVYNALAAAAAVEVLGLDLNLAKKAAEKVKAAFGRVERFTMEGRLVCIILVKNPSGFNEVLRTLLADDRPKGLLFLLNDNIPDGRDVSWIWDVDFESLRGRINFCVAGGIRAHDMALRLKYAELFSCPEGGASGLLVERDSMKALRLGLERTPVGLTLYVMPTYTAMWDLRRALAHGGYLEAFWA